MRSRVYVDGFNLYYHIRATYDCKWLDILRLCKTILPTYDIDHIKYFTAPVIARPNDPDQPIRQELYFRALRTLPSIDIIKGEFRVDARSMPVADTSVHPPTIKYLPGTSTIEKVTVIKTEEKGSDVNLASHLIYDGFLNLYDAAVIISNDTDLAEPLRIVHDEIGKHVALLPPSAHAHFRLAQYSDLQRPIRYGAVRSCQFPQAMVDATGPFHKPPTW